MADSSIDSTDLTDGHVGGAPRVSDLLIDLSEAVGRAGDLPPGLGYAAIIPLSAPAARLLRGG